MRRFFTLLLVFVLLVAGIAAWIFLGPGTRRPDRQYLYVTGNVPARTELMQQINGKDLLSNPRIFEITGNVLKVWSRVRPGRYEIQPRENIWTLLMRLRRNQQSEVKLVINRIRTKEQLASVLARSFEIDSADLARYLLRNDSLRKLDTDTNQVLSLVIPDTYRFRWTPSPFRILSRLKEEKEVFWNRNNRREKLEALGLSEQQVYTIASIVEEETNQQEEKDTIASVYINRYRKGMNLGADPTIKYALRNFGLRRILFGHLNVESPYNTYRNAGLPPGPICTPGKGTIDATLAAPSTGYLFFVARDDFKGFHKFSETYSEHQTYARQYQQKLNAYLAAKNAGL